MSQVGYELVIMCKNVAASDALTNALSKEDYEYTQRLIDGTNAVSIPISNGIDIDKLKILVNKIDADISTFH